MQLVGSSSFGAVGVAAKRDFRALAAFVAFQASDLFPALRLRDGASAEGLGIVRKLIQHTQVADSIPGNDFHVHHGHLLIFKRLRL